MLWADSSTRLPDGTEFQFWEKPLTFSKTYYVDGRSAAADDSGPGSRERPFRTIGKAAEVLQPGERVVIAEGIYRELVSPARGGSGPDRMISYEAAPGAKVIVRGSVVLNKGWTRSSSGGGRGGAAAPGGGRGGATAAGATAWQIDLDSYLPSVYNPFALVNAPGSLYWTNFKEISMAPYFRRRGMLFVDGKPLEQMDQCSGLFGSSGGRSQNYWEDIRWRPLFEEIGGAGGKFCVEQQGNTIHVRLPNDDSPDKHVIEATVRQQVFAPKARGLGYIRVKGITFQHSSDPIPLPQPGGVVVTSGGNHWIIEDNTIEWGNSLCLAVGGGGSHVIRGNTIRYCGIGGIEGVGAGNVGVIEKNLVEWVGWQDSERSWESGAVKLHGARNLLFRNNVIRHIRFAAGFWLDVSNVNCRATGNIISDIVSVSGIIHIEGTHEQNQIDNNVIWGVKNSEPTGTGLEGSGGSCFFIHGTDKLIIAQNLFANCQTMGIFSTPVATRLIGTRGGTARDNKIYNNIFYAWGTAAIGFSNEHNQTDGNVYVPGAGRGGYLRILAPEPQQWLDLAAWREFYGWDNAGALGTAEEIAFNPDTLELTLVPGGAWPRVAVFNSVDTDFFGVATGDKRSPGPFADLEKRYKGRNIDPRK